MIYWGVFFFVLVDFFVVRKLCGFKGYLVYWGCLKCFKYFLGIFNEKIDYFGFDRDFWFLCYNSSYCVYVEMV